MPDEDVKRPANNLRIARARAGLTVKAVAAHCGVVPTTYWRWEKAHSPIPPEQIEALAQLLGVSREYIVGWRPTSEEFAELEAKGAA